MTIRLHLTAPLMAASLALSGCSDDLDPETQNEVNRDWTRVVLTCGSRDKPSPARFARARASLADLIDQYRETPDGRAQLIESDEPDPMSLVLDLIARPRNPPWRPECDAISRAAADALDKK